jgi:cold shock CspA family protein
MSSSVDSKLIKIGVFYDGNYFFHVSNFYLYSHPRRSRLSIVGIHEFIRNQAAQYENVDIRLCQVVDSHYFRGRLSAQEADVRNKLYQERAFDDVLMREGVVTHYLPLSRQGEKGIDVWLALEAYELAVVKHFNVVVLIACDGDYVPLVRKINALGTRVMVLAWDFQYTDETGNVRATTTSVKLLEEASYPVLMHNIIDDKTRRTDPFIANLFVPQRDTFNSDSSLRSGSNMFNSGGSLNGSLSAPQTVPSATSVTGLVALGGVLGELYTGRIATIKEGYGFIATDQANRSIFFYWGDVLESDFNSLRVGDPVQFTLGMNDKGECAKEVRRVGLLQPDVH